MCWRAKLWIGVESTPYTSPARSANNSSWSSAFPHATSKGSRMRSGAEPSAVANDSRSTYRRCDWGCDTLNTPRNRRSGVQAIHPPYRAAVASPGAAKGYSCCITTARSPVICRWTVAKAEFYFTGGRSGPGQLQRCTDLSHCPTDEPGHRTMYASKNHRIHPGHKNKCIDKDQRNHQGHEKKHIDNDQRDHRANETRYTGKDQRHQDDEDYTPWMFFFRAETTTPIGVRGVPRTTHSWTSGTMEKQQPLELEALHCGTTYAYIQVSNWWWITVMWLWYRNQSLSQPNKKCLTFETWYRCLGDWSNITKYRNSMTRNPRKNKIRNTFWKLLVNKWEMIRIKLKRILQSNGLWCI